MSKRLFTSESVTEGHPDKMCDQISDAILDALLEKDPMARVACEAITTTGIVFVAGEVTTHCYIDIESIVRKTVREIGYNRAKYGFDCDSCAVVTSLKGQSPDIAMGVDMALEVRKGLSDDGEEETGAGDQGMMFGYACNETDVLMPMPIDLAHKIAKKLSDVRKDQTIDYLRPDGKSQVTVEYENNKPKRVDCVVVSTQHNPEISHEQIEKDVIEKVIKAVIPAHLIDENTKYLINPTGRFVVGGPQGDCGLTGRKIIVDTYGGAASHGGGCFSGKDPTKVDRSAAYMARYVAKNIVAAGIAEQCQIEVAYAIGVSRPVSVVVNTFGTGKITDDAITALVNENFDMRPAAIIKQFDLRRPIYKQTAAYGHFGRNDIDVPWEKTDKADMLRAKLNL
ncbi:MAG: methionine adenosyltransferase [Clostridiales bacterium]|jgi:S-adenosylmethionine synthetase|nr:methionine adenosyltransferase [Clostridiales bacterium]